MNSYNVLDERSDFFIDEEIKRWMKNLFGGMKKNSVHYAG
jgi:hypothetical protein